MDGGMAGGSGELSVTVHFRSKTFQHHQTSAEVSGQFSTSAEVSCITLCPVNAHSLTKQLLYSRLRLRPIVLH